MTFLIISHSVLQEKATRTLLMFDNSVVDSQPSGICHSQKTPTVQLAQEIIDKGKPTLWSKSLHHKLGRVLQNNNLDVKVSQFLLAILECIANNILKASQAFFDTYLPLLNSI